jgi:hypothetical protein
VIGIAWNGRSGSPDNVHLVTQSIHGGLASDDRVFCDDGGLILAKRASIQAEDACYQKNSTGGLKT